MKRLFLFFVAFASMNCSSLMAQSVFKKYKDVTTPTIFEEGDISVNAVQWNNYFDKNGNFFYTLQGKTKSYLIKRTLKNGKYGEMEYLPLDTTAINSDIWVSAKGDEILYMSTKLDDEKTEGFNIWSASLRNGKWTEKPLSKPTSGPGGEGYPVKTRSGNIYFSVARDGSRNSDVYVLKEGASEASKLPETINSDKFEGDAFIAPDESYIIFAAFDREENLGLSDLFISFKTTNGWTEAKWMGVKYNSEGYDGSPYVTRDGKYFVFTSSRASLGTDGIFFNHYIIPFNPQEFR